MLFKQIVVRPAGRNEFHENGRGFDGNEQEHDEPVGPADGLAVLGERAERFEAGSEAVEAGAFKLGNGRGGSGILCGQFFTQVAVALLQYREGGGGAVGVRFFWLYR